MNTVLSLRLALALSAIGLALAATSLSIALDEPRPIAARTDSLSPSWADELTRRNDALASEIESLRGEIGSLRGSLESRREVDVPRARGPEVAAEGRATDLAAVSEIPADDGMGDFLLRRELLAKFHGLDADDREDALEELADLARWGDEEALKLIAGSLTDESGKVRARALKELADLDEANLAVYLRQTIADPSGSVREVVASHLDDLSAEEAGPLLVGLLGDSNEDVVLAAIKSIDELEYAEAKPFLVKQLQAEDLDIATRAAYALMELGDAGAAAGTIERILRAFAQGDVSDRLRDVKRLRRLKATAQLEKILESDQSLAVREEAREALAKLED